MVQDAGEIIQVIVPGTVVADCAGETVVEVGDDNLSISNLIYYPYRLSEVEVGLSDANAAPAIDSHCHCCPPMPPPPTSTATISPKHPLQLIS